MLSLRAQVRALGIFLAVTFIPTHVGAVRNEPTPPLPEILERMVDRAEWADKADLKQNYQFLLETTSEKLNKDKDSSSRDVRLYRSTPDGEGHLEQLIEKNGRPLSEKERQRDERDQDEFRTRMAKGRNESSGREDRVKFDRDMLARYQFTFEGRQLVGDRETYVLSFEPKPGKLPVKKRIDQALNKGEGQLWVDAGTFDLARVKFRLREKIGLWFGLIGSISEMEGDIRLEPVADGVWLPREVSFYINGRILFSSLHRRETVRWSQYQSYQPAAATSQ